MLAKTVNVKRDIARQFGKAAMRYDQHANVQWQIAQQAIALLPEYSQVLLDIGCATGRASSLLQQRCAHFIGCDLALPMLQQAQRRAVANYVAGDAECLPMQTASINTIYSSMALQWCASPTAVLHELHRVLAPVGKAVLAVPVSGSLLELSQSWAAVADGSTVNHFANHTNWQHWAQQAGFRARVRVIPHQQFFTDLQGVLGSIKQVGANQLVNPSRSGLTRSLLSQWQRAYQQEFAVNDQLPLTYQVAFMQLSKA